MKPLHLNDEVKLFASARNRFETGRIVAFTTINGVKHASVETRNETYVVPVDTLETHKETKE